MSASVSDLLSVIFRDGKNSMTCYVFLFVCISYVVAQIPVPQPQFATNIEKSRQLSPQQQGQILSDIQQHHHRFDLPQNQQNFQPQHVSSPLSDHSSQSIQSNLQQHYTSNIPQEPVFFQQPPILDYNRQLIQQQQFSHNLGQENFARNEFLSTLPLTNSLPIQAQLPQFSQQRTFLSNQGQIPSGPVLPTVQTLTQGQNASPGKVIQHHTQTGFQPNFANGLSRSSQFPNNFLKPRPTEDPVALIEQQIQLLDPEKHKEKIKELREKQAIIEKHSQFVEKQYEKALKKAQQDHEQFVEQQKEQKKKLYQKLYKPASSEPLHYLHSPSPRIIYPEEIGLFEQAVKQYYIEHPTTVTAATTTTTTTTITPVTSKKTGIFLPTAIPQTKLKTIQSIDDLDQLQKQYKSQRIRKDDLLEQLRLAIGKSHEEDIGRNLSSREISLANGKKIQIIEANDSKDLPKGKEEEITLPNGSKVTVIRADNPNASHEEEVVLPSGHQVQIFKTTDLKSVPDGISSGLQEITLPNGQKAQLIKSPSTNFEKVKPALKTEEITLPNGEKVEVIKTTDPNLLPGGVKLEPGSDLEKLVLSRTTTTTTIRPPKAILEELTKGVPDSNYEILKTGASGSLEAISKNLPNQKKVTFVLLEEQSDGTLKVQGIKGNGKDKPDVDVDSILKKIKQGQFKLPKLELPSTSTIKPETTTIYQTVPPTITPNSFVSDESEEEFSYTKSPLLFTSEDDADIPILKTNIGTQIVASSTPTSIYTQQYSSSTKNTTPRSVKTHKESHKKTSRTPHILNNSPDLIKQASSVSSSNQNALPSSSSHLSSPQQITVPIHPQETHAQDVPPTAIELPDVLKKEGLYAMAKFLRQSGLDTILNETGPYTVFVPSDKAFRTLLVQLGGPERAEEKFKENPRLLSGLLLHHVIPGAFKIDSLQDEMTGVSLAGTQLRVNQYNMHDLEWNDVKITTINGAKISDDKKDIEIPQGVAHAIDRVMFPLPVGDIVQTLQSDRERRFTSFLRAIFASGLSESLQGTKTFTVFAPTEKAFAGLSSEDLSRTVTDKVLARELVLRHLLAGTLYTNGMRYFQIKESLLQDKQLTFSKQTGKVKVNNVLIATQNIPTTNGVIHAIDTLL